jgi:hypothetical protein
MISRRTAGRADATPNSKAVVRVMADFILRDRAILIVGRWGKYDKDAYSNCTLSLVIEADFIPHLGHG